MSDELPQGWASVPLQEVVSDVQPGFASGEKNVEGGVAHLRMNNIGLDSKLLLDLIRTVPEKLVKPHHVLQSGDVLVCTTNSSKLVGKCALFDLPGRYAFSNHLTRLRPKPQLLDSRFLCWNLWLHWRRGTFDDQCKNWVNQSTIPKSVLLETEVDVPPLAEQQRIVAKLEALLGQVNACQQRLDKIPTLLKRFRQSVLAAACSGRLTEDWREESAAATGQEDSLPAADLPEIPDSWRWVKLPDTGDMSRGKSRHRPRNEPSLFGGPYPFIQTGDIAQSGGRITNHKQTYSEAGLAQSRLWPTGTICITIAANIAESAILTYPACFPDSVVGIIANAKISVAEYVEFFIRVAKDDLATFAPATAQKNINIGILNEVQVPLPPLPEQQEIVRRVESLFALADNIEQRYKKAQAFIDKLTPSLLAKAFRGELVHQDPNDEPASVLLGRIKVERVKTPHNSKHRKEAHA